MKYGGEGGQAETQHWTLKWYSKAFWYSDKPIQVINKGCTLARTTLRRNKTLHNS